MKRAFVRTDDGQLKSAMVPQSTPDVLRLGDRITATGLWDLGRGAQIKAGEAGTVDYLDAATGGAEVLMDTPFRGLEAWDNHVLLEPFHTEELLARLTLTPQSWVRRVKPPRWAYAVAASVLVSVVVALLHNFFYTAPTLEFTLIRDAETAAAIFTRTLLITLAIASTIIVST